MERVLREGLRSNFKIQLHLHLLLHGSQSMSVIHLYKLLWSSIVPEQKQWHRYMMRKQDAAFYTNGSRLTPTDCRPETGPIVLSGRDISNLLPKVARTGRELLGIAFVKPAAKNLALGVASFAVCHLERWYLLPVFPAVFARYVVSADVMIFGLKCASLGTGISPMVGHGENVRARSSTWSINV